MVWNGKNRFWNDLEVKIWLKEANQAYRGKFASVPPPPPKRRGGMPKIKKTTMVCHCAPCNKLLILKKKA